MIFNISGEDARGIKVLFVATSFYCLATIGVVIDMLVWSGFMICGLSCFLYGLVLLKPRIEKISPQLTRWLFILTVVVIIGIIIFSIQAIT